MITHLTRVVLFVSIFCGGCGVLFSQKISNNQGSISVSIDHHAGTPNNPLFWCEDNLFDNDESSLFEKEEDTKGDSLATLSGSSQLVNNQINLFGNFKNKVVSFNSSKLFLLFCCLKLYF